MHRIGVLEVVGSDEKRLQPFLGSRDDGGVIAKEQSAQDGHQHDTDEVALVSFVFFHKLCSRFVCKSNHFCWYLQFFLSFNAVFLAISFKIPTFAKYNSLNITQI